jgi:uncharacterized cupin superfamily protein
MRMRIRSARYVLEGTIGARVGDREVVAGAGSYLKPRGLHTFWNAGPGPARLLEVIAPAGFETYFAELAEEDRFARVFSGRSSCSGCAVRRAFIGLA